MRLRISARKSDLARLQAYQVGQALQKKTPPLEIQYNFRESLGDKNLTDPLWKMPEKGVFTEDFVQDLLDEKTDLVVHSWKDLPTAPRQGTEIVATLPRADQRDLLLFKKSARKNPGRTLNIFSSSPRRAYNLQVFLKTHLPFELQSIEFQNVRGNIQTRVRKLIEDSEVQGLIVAKAALDRLLSAPETEFQETQSFLLSAFQELDWMVLPLSVNPNAAAQGALAIEIKQGRADLQALLSGINCQDTFECAQKEREVLAGFGGGCQQKIGVAVLKRSYGQVFFLKGLADSGQVLDENSILGRAVGTSFLPEQLASSKELEVTRHQDVPFEIPKKASALWIAKAEALPVGFKHEGLLWTAGLKTWEKLAQAGYWVHGSSESLGEDEDPQISALHGKAVQWTKLSHKEAPRGAGKEVIATYRVTVSAKEWRIGNREAFFWHSGSQFLAAYAKEPELKNKKHGCGPGNTYKILRESLGPEASIEIYLNEDEWRKSCSR